MAEKVPGIGALLELLERAAAQKAAPAVTETTLPSPPIETPVVDLPLVPGGPTGPSPDVDAIRRYLYSQSFKPDPWFGAGPQNRIFQQPTSPSWIGRLFGIDLPAPAVSPEETQARYGYGYVPVEPSQQAQAFPTYEDLKAAREKKAQEAKQAIGVGGGAPAPPTAARPLTMPITTAVTGAKKEPSEEVSFDVPPEYGDWASDRLSYLTNMGADSATALKIVKDELAQKMREGVAPTSTEALRTTTTAATTAQPPIWEAQKPTDWATQLEDIVSKSFPQWKDLPQMTGLPEWKEQKRPFLDTLLTGLTHAFAGYDPMKLKLEREAGEKVTVEKRREEAIADIQAQRNYAFKKQSVITDAKLKALDIRRDTENKVKSDQLAWAQMLVDADPQSINKPQVMSIIARNRGVTPDQIKDLYDSTTGKYKIARSPLEVELEKTEGIMEWRRKAAPRIGLKGRDAEEFAITGKVPNMDPKEFFDRQYYDALQDFQRTGNRAKVTQAVTDRMNFMVSNDVAYQKELRDNQAMLRDLPEILKKLPPEARDTVSTYMMLKAYTKGTIPNSLIASIAFGGGVGKGKKEAQIVVDAKAARKNREGYDYFKNTYPDLDPEDVISAAAGAELKLKSPATAIDMGLDVMGLTGKARADFEVEMQMEQIAKQQNPKLPTPRSDLVLDKSVSAIRMRYHELINEIEIKMKRRLETPELLGLYNLKKQIGFLTADEYIKAKKEQETRGAK